ncbi:MAG: YgiQ family radical SAM protein [Spirochaetaceae bacterium]
MGKSWHHRGMRVYDEGFLPLTMDEFRRRYGFRPNSGSPSAASASPSSNPDSPSSPRDRFSESETEAEEGEAQADFIIVTGDAYVDHPSFGAALIGRLLEEEGYRVAIIAQPDWRGSEDFTRFGRPRLAFLVTAGNLDSMVSNYSARRRPRRGDDYSPGGRSGMRPDRASIVYTSRIRQAYKGVTVVLGGIEASLRRLSHYDYWSNSIRRPLILDAKADYLIYGMAERSLPALARLLDKAEQTEQAEKKEGGSRQPLLEEDLAALPGLVWIASSRKGAADGLNENSIVHTHDMLLLPSFDEMKSDITAYAPHFALQTANADPFSGKHLAEGHGNRWVVQNPPAKPLSSKEFDRIFELPYTRRGHPVYDKAGGVPALGEVQFSLVSSRGCFGGCSFCALTFHQGRIITPRSHESLIREAKLLTAHPQFKGNIHDVGGPTANFRRPACRAQLKRGACPDKQCLFPEPCASLEVDHKDYLQLLRKLRSLPGVKKVFIRSGIRYDYLLLDRDTTFFQELVRHHISGQLKVAPEHAGKKSLEAMGKPPIEVYREFRRRFEEETRRAGLKQYLIPYLIAGHPGSTLSEAVELALFLKESGFVPDQVQDFYPTPGTLSTCMWATGIDPRTMESVYVPKSEKERNLQRALLQFNRRENYPKVREALKQAGRTDLIGRGRDALVPP